MKIDLTDDELHLLFKKFEDRQLAKVNYMEFIRTLDPETYLPESLNAKQTIEPSVDSTSVESIPDVDSIMDRIRYHVATKRIRIAEFFRDFDKLRSYSIPRQEFIRGVNRIGLSLTDAEYECLADKYTDSAKKGCCKWKDFEQTVECVFNDVALESQPTKIPSTTIVIQSPFIMTGQLTDEEMDLLRSTLTRIGEHLKLRQTSIKPFFKDFDKLYTGHVTKTQFRQCLTYLKVNVTDAEFDVLCKRWGKPADSVEPFPQQVTVRPSSPDPIKDGAERICYLKFLQELEMGMNGNGVGDTASHTSAPTAAVTVAKDAKNVAEAGKEKLPKRQAFIKPLPPAEVDKLLMRIKTKAKTERMRVIDFMADFDHLRHGKITRNEFRRVLKVLFLNLTEAELLTLESMFACDGGKMVDYRAFSDAVESVFTIKGLEKAPLVEPPEFDGYENGADPALNVLDEKEEKILEKVVIRLREKVRQRRIDVLSYLEDFDFVREGTITTNQFRSVLGTINLPVDDDEIKVLARRFTTDQNLDRINYRAFAWVLMEEGLQKQDLGRAGGRRVGGHSVSVAVNSFGICEGDDYYDEERDDGSSNQAGKRAPSMQISQAKLQAFQVGIHKKTPFQKAKEAEEAKRKREEDEAAKVYAEFVASFESDPSSGLTKKWVKGSTIVPSVLSDKQEEQATGPPAGTLYKPQMLFDFEKESKSDAPSKPPPPKSGKKRQLDAFLEEIKQHQEEKESRTRQKTGKGAGMVGGTSDPPVRAIDQGSEMGSYDTGDPDTTNLYVGNINPTVDEEALCKLFAVYGPIASVKVMWPRTQEERDRNRNCGFVSFMKRSDAAIAVKELDGKDLKGYVMRVGWGKAVPIPSQPIYVLDPDARPPPSGLPFNAQIPSQSGAGQKGSLKLIVHCGVDLKQEYLGLLAFAAIPPPGASSSRPTQAPPRPEVRVVKPENAEVLMLIHRTIERVIHHGPMFEALLMDREGTNPLFTFLFQNDSPEHAYYRWKLYSLLNGDSKSKWPTEPFSMFDEGPIWIPPPVPFDEEEFDGASDMSYDSDDSQAPRRPKPASNVPKGTLASNHRARLESMIRKLTMEREKIARLMIFCIDHAEAAEEICDVMIKSLLIPGTPVFPTKMSRLYLVSDVLHNSSLSVPGAWKFRTTMEKQLPAVFTHFGTVWKTIAARLRAEQMRKAVFAVIEVWEKGSIFTRDFTNGLKEAFMEAGKAAAAKEAAAMEAKERDEKFRRSLQEQKESKTGVFAFEDELDGVPLSTQMEVGKTSGGGNDDDDEDVDGVPMDVGSAGAKDGSSAETPSKAVGSSSSFQPVEPVKSRPTFVPAGKFVPATMTAAKTTTTKLNEGFSTSVKSTSNQKKPTIKSKIFQDEDDDDDMFG
ncbi:hypothetical protein HDU76_003229 [Blyttiomyces sp. JEL0837]|nr:hypothetical protein HDU76_003229 [Blyttiomyces sp. JEL0837]